MGSEVEELVAAAAREFSSGRLDQAERYCRQALSIEPDSFEATFWLVSVLRKKGQRSESLALAFRAVELRPKEGHAHLNLGFMLSEDGRTHEAADSFGRAAKLLSNDPIAQIAHARSLLSVGKVEPGLSALRRASELAPTNGSIQTELAEALLQSGDWAEAAESATKAFAIDARNGRAFQALIDALILDGKSDRAVQMLRGAIQLNPRDVGAHSNLGKLLNSLGRFDEAEAEYRKSIDLQPVQGFAYYGIVQSRTINQADRALIDRMDALSQETRIDPKGVAYLHYALGKSFEDLGDFQAAMSRYDSGNAISLRLNQASHPFDRTQYAASVDRTIDLLSKEFIDRNKRTEAPSDRPIFIVGMPRSGTTLIEQILSAHPSVLGGGENIYWKKAAPQLLATNQRDLKAQLNEAANRYEESLGEGYLRVTDKMPGNYSFLGLLYAAFPNAAFINARRNPIDTCLSIWANGSSFKLPFINDKENIVFALRQYERVMKHWRSLLPANRLLEVDYESLIGDRERVTREIVSFCGLEWDERCLHPEQNERTVSTPSVWQVRQPVYTSSVERWKRFEPWLGAFRELA